MSKIQSNIDYASIGQRLRAYRIAASLKAEDVVNHLKISRAAVYRLEKGEIIKIETLDRLAKLLNTSVSSLLGVDTEYYVSGDGFFERMRQLEEQSTNIFSHFDPFSFLLMSDDYLSYLAIMIHEASCPKDEVKIAKTLSILKKRKTNYQTNSSKMINLIGLQNIERFLHLGLVGNLNISESERSKRRKLAKKEVIYLIDKLEAEKEKEKENLEIAITQESIPTFTFQIFYHNDNPLALANSPFRLGELPNVETGIASITNSNESIRHHQNLFNDLWKNGVKNQQAIELLKKTLVNY